MVHHGLSLSLEQFVYTITLLIITWEIWKERCTGRYKDGYVPQESVVTKVILFIRHCIFSLSTLFSVKRGSTDDFWRKASLLCIIMAWTIQFVLASILVYWIKPPFNFIALNVDGASSGGQAEEGDIIRDHHGNHIANFFCYYGFGFGSGSNNLAETRALLDGLLLCKFLGYPSIIIQSDSSLVVGWARKFFSILWNLKPWWNLFSIIWNILNEAFNTLSVRATML